VSIFCFLPKKDATSNSFWEDIGPEKTEVCIAISVYTRTVDLPGIRYSESPV
jgi:hypothetical protein